MTDEDKLTIDNLKFYLKRNQISQEEIDKIVEAYINIPEIIPIFPQEMEALVNARTRTS